MRRTIAILVPGLLAAAACGGVASAGSLTAAPGPQAGLHVPVTPSRVLDTYRSLGSAPIAAGHAGTVRMTGVGGVPTSGVTAVQLTVTASRPQAGGFLTVYPSGTARPKTSNVNFVAGDSQADAVYAPVGVDGRVAIYNGSSGAVRVLGDVTGYFVGASGSPAGAYVATTPTRVYDTRGGSALGARVTRHVPVLGHGGVPATGVSAVVATVTALYPDARGYLRVWGPNSQPSTANVYFAARRTVGNLVVSQVDSDGGIEVFNGSDAPLGLVVDVQGYFLAGSRAAMAGSYVPTVPSRQVGEQPVASAGTVSLIKLNQYQDGASADATELLNLTITGARADGFAVGYGTATRPPLVSSESITGGLVSSGVVTGPSTLHVYNGSGSPVHLTVDRFGYFASAPVTIRGTVTDDTSGADVAGVPVLVHARHYDDDEGVYVDTPAGMTTTAADGTYSFRDLVAGLNYVVCFYGLDAAGSDASIGYGNRCYDGVDWTMPGYGRNATPGNATQLTVPNPGGVAHADQSLPRVVVGTVIGRVAPIYGRPASGVRIGATPAGGNPYQPGQTITTDSNGTYRLRLPVGSRDVCFYPPPGLDHVPPLPAHTCRTLTITAGDTTELDVTLPVQGEISGTAIGGRTTVAVFIDAANPYLERQQTGVSEDGHYSITLDPGSYYVCFYSPFQDAAAPYSYAPECDDDVPAPGIGSGAGVPHGATPVALGSDGNVTVDAVLAHAGAISGSVTAASSGDPLYRVRVSVYSGHALVGAVSTNAAGRYLIDQLPALPTGYSVCFQPGAATSLAAQCYDGIAWTATASGPPAAGATPVRVTAGAKHDGIDAALHE